MNTSTYTSKYFWKQVCICKCQRYAHVVVNSRTFGLWYLREVPGIGYIAVGGQLVALGLVKLVPGVGVRAGSQRGGGDVGVLVQEH